MNLKQTRQALDEQKLKAWAKDQEFRVEEEGSLLNLYFSIKVPGIKDLVDLVFEFEKVYQGALILRFYQVVTCSVNLGAGRLRTLEATLDEWLDDSLLFEDTVNDFLVRHHLERYTGEYYQQSYESAYSLNYTLPFYEVFDLLKLYRIKKEEAGGKTLINHFVYWNGMIFQKLPYDHALMPDPNHPGGVLYGPYENEEKGTFLTIAETQEIFKLVKAFDYDHEPLRLFPKSIRDLEREMTSSHRLAQSDLLSFQEFCVLNEWSFEDAIHQFESFRTKGDWIELELLDEKCFEKTFKTYRAGDYVQLVENGGYAVISDVVDSKVGLYEVQREDERYGGRMHISQFKKVRTPDQSLKGTLVITKEGEIGTLTEVGYTHSKFNRFEAKNQPSEANEQQLLKGYQNVTCKNEDIFEFDASFIGNWEKEFSTLSLKSWYTEKLSTIEYQMLGQLLTYYRLFPWEETYWTVGEEYAFNFLLTFLIQKPSFLTELNSICLRMIMEVDEQGSETNHHSSRAGKIGAFGPLFFKTFQPQGVFHPLFSENHSEA